MCSLVPTLPLKAARSKLGMLFRLGSNVTAGKSRCLDQNYFEVHHRWRCVRRNPRFRSEFARTRASSTWPFLLRRRAGCQPNVLSRDTRDCVFDVHEVSPGVFDVLQQ